VAPTTIDRSVLRGLSQEVVAVRFQRAGAAPVPEAARFRPTISGTFKTCRHNLLPRSSSRAAGTGERMTIRFPCKRQT